MKVLDLQCVHGHTFEGWFASESDFLAQCQKALVQCPMCGDSSVVKKLSAPRLHLAGKRSAPSGPVEVLAPAQSDSTFTAAWLALARQVLANTTDVGERFAEEARKMHYGETQERSIRGQTSVQEARSLAEEGIDVLPFALPEVLKETLQ